MAADFAEELLQRLDRYVRIDTQSDAASPTSPSTEKQHDLLNLLVEELTELGVADVRQTDYGAVLATIPATAATDAPTIALLAHVDTTPQFTGTGVRPIVHRSWQGGDIVLPDDPRMVLRAAELPYLATKVGQDIVTGSGTTLLGADDKAGVAIIMATARHLLRHRDIPHGPLRICFTPDEEIGRGVHADLPRDLGAAFAYTLDGAELGEIVHETFSADAAVVTVQGISIHPGSAKGKLVNALHLAARIVDTLPQVTLTPETTDGRQGFIHLYEMGGSAASARLQFILRDFEEAGLRAHGELLQWEAFTDAVERIEDDARPPFLSELAELAGLSVRHLTRAFTERTGFSVHAFIERRRFDKAAQLLRATDMPIAEISQQLAVLLG